MCCVHVCVYKHTPLARCLSCAHMKKDRKNDRMKGHLSAHTNKQAKRASHTQPKAAQSAVGKLRFPDFALNSRRQEKRGFAGCDEGWETEIVCVGESWEAFPPQMTFHYEVGTKRVGGEARGVRQTPGALSCDHRFSRWCWT